MMYAFGAQIWVTAYKTLGTNRKAIIGGPSLDWTLCSAYKKKTIVIKILEINMCQ